MIRFILYSRNYCHLCDEMLEALNKLRAEFEFEFEVDIVDVDADPALVELYDELVPVLVGIKQGQEPIQLSYYHLDEKAVKDYLIDKKSDFL